MEDVLQAPSVGSGGIKSIGGTESRSRASTYDDRVRASARQETEAEIRTGKERLEALLINADGAILILDPAGRVSWASPTAEHVWGLPVEDVVGRKVAGYVHPGDRRSVIRTFAEVAAGEVRSSARLEGRVRRADGSWRWFEAIFTNRMEPPVDGIVANVRDITDQVRGLQALRESELRLEHQARHDPLTNLPNRLLLFERMEMALSRSCRNHTKAAVLFCDLDRFKVVNDSQGHTQGDELLVKVARRLEAAIGPGGTISRFGGDEFIVLVEDLIDDHDAFVVADRIREALLEPFMVRHAEVVVSASIGISMADNGVPTPEILIRDADSAMYRAKAKGRARAVIFDDRMRARAVERHQVEATLRQAVAAKQLEVHYQPVIDLRTDRIAGVEALVRWQHPTRGMLYPDTFITVAEETGLIVPLGAWIFDEACAATVRCNMTAAHHEDVFVAVNLSAYQLADPSLVGEIAAVLAATGIDPGRVHIEITESVLMHDAEASKDVLDRLKRLGVRVAIDDFGTGYSSLSYLRRFPVDILKIDQSFIAGIGRDPEADTIVEALVHLGQSLDLDVVAEGVETQHQLDELRRHGCQFAQGFLMSRARPAVGLSDLLGVELAAEDSI